MSGIDYTKWHTYRVDWTARKITWYVDDKQMWSYEKSAKQSELDSGQWPFDYPFYLILNQSVGNGSWASAPDTNHTYETQFDWVRVYQMPEDVTGIQELEGDVSQLEDARSSGTFDLTGRRLSGNFRGIAIVNGQKVIR